MTDMASMLITMGWGANSSRSFVPSWSVTSGFRRVASINAPGHKYGLVYPGVGWIVWRDSAALPEDPFWVNYLGDEMPTFALNFSRPDAQVVAQSYMALRLGCEGIGGCRATRANRPCVWQATPHFGAARETGVGATRRAAAATVKALVS